MNPKLLWKPTSSFKDQSNLTAYIQWLNHEKGLELETYDSIWQWSTEEVGAFWKSLMEYFKINFSGDYKRPEAIDHFIQLSQRLAF